MQNFLWRLLLLLLLSAVIAETQDAAERVLDIVRCKTGKFDTCRRMTAGKKEDFEDYPDDLTECDGVGVGFNDQQTWTAFLRNDFQIRRVKFSSGTLGCPYEIKRYEIFVNNQKCASHDVMNERIFPGKTFACNATGSSVKITVRNANTYVWGLKIFGVPVRTITSPQLHVRHCIQSSVQSGGGCHKAIDGNINKVYNRGSCTHTQLGNNNWWTGSLTNESQIRHVRIHNRMDCCSDRLTNFEILVDGRKCAAYNGEFFSVKAFRCNAVGSSITISSRRRTYLTLCEVEVYGTPVSSIPGQTPQLHLSHCSQSSFAWGSPCWRAMDGNTKQIYEDGLCTYTAHAELNNWWTGSLTNESQIRYVRIYNRMDCCSDRLTNFEILVDGRKCASYHMRDGAFFSVKTFTCDAVGTSITILSRRRSYLTLCEVQVFGTPVIMNLSNITEAKLDVSDCSQSSVESDASCEKAIDGNTDQVHADNSCAQTQRGNNNWWTGSLMQNSQIRFVRIHNRILDNWPDRLTNFDILVNDRKCASFDAEGGSFFSVKTFRCDAVGNSVKILSRRRGSYLILCEVEVFGSPV